MQHEATQGTRYYTRRRLSPFLGTLQVVEVPDARAYSTDGVHWELRLFSMDPIPDRVWGNIGPRATARRWYRYGRWSREAGEERGPVNPAVGDPTRHPGLERLRAALATLPACPFPARDTVELWLLDRETRLPVALQGSLCPNEALPPRSDLTWQATGRADVAFPAPSLAGLPEQRPAGVLLNEFVRQRTAGGQWFKRDPEGGGQAVGDVRVAPELAGRHLPSRDFPDTPLVGTWQNELAVALVVDYARWLAPLLLTLPGLSRERRDQLERAAVKQALLLDRIHRVIPAFVDRRRIDVALVEAAIRKRA
jgi:hypothetical protein